LLNKEKLDKINFLSKKSKKEKLSVEELEEQKELRQEYLKVFRKSFKNRLKNIKVVDTKEEYDHLTKEQKRTE
jgi:uncharacterized protein YnzC (UPF0291/DUF896 family)